MTFIIIVIAFLFTLFLATLSIIRVLNKARLKSSLKKANGKAPESVIIDTLVKLIKADPDDIVSRQKLAREYIKANNFSEAINHLNYILNNNKNLTELEKKETYEMLARCYTSMKNYKEAYKIYSTLRSQNPEDASNYNNMAHINIYLGKKEEAIKLLSKAITLDEENLEAIKELGTLLYNSNKYPEAIAAFQKGYSVNADDPEVNYYLGLLHYRFEKAKDAYKHFLVSKNDTRFAIESLFYIGKILFQYNKLDNALRVFEKLLKLPNIKRDLMLNIRYNIAEIYLKNKDIAKAIEQWEKILSYTSNFKDVREKLDRYEQTKTNSLLRKYLMSSKNDFLSLCKKIASNFAKDVIIIRSQIDPDSSVELFIQAIYQEVETTILFKFFRSNSNIGQFAIREFYETVKESKAKLGVCFTTSGYTEEAIEYSKGRVIELYDKKALVKLLSKIKE